jgi:hypothetical protein
VGRQVLDNQKVIKIIDLIFECFDNAKRAAEKKQENSDGFHGQF